MSGSEKPILTKEEFLHRAQQLIDADEEMLDDLYPMAHDLLALAQQVTRIVEEQSPLSQTASGE